MSNRNKQTHTRREQIYHYTYQVNTSPSKLLNLKITKQFKNKEWLWRGLPTFIKDTAFPEQWDTVNATLFLFFLLDFSQLLGGFPGQLIRRKIVWDLLSLVNQRSGSFVARSGTSSFILKEGQCVAIADEFRRDHEQKRILSNLRTENQPLFAGMSGSLSGRGLHLQDTFNQDSWVK